jgi:hypothetical protein
MNAETEYIGTAKALEDGTILLFLIAKGDGDRRGEAVIKIAPTDERYLGIVSQLGGIKPGETKRVPAWGSPPPPPTPEPPRP